MRRFHFGSLALPILLLCGCGGPPEQSAGSGNAGTETAAAQAERYSIVAGPITGNATSGINGTFRVVRAQAGQPGIPSDRIGGACIAFRAEDLGLTQMAQKTCTNDSQCGAPGAYCDTATSKCWAKPAGTAADAALCRRSIDPDVQRAWDSEVNNQVSDGPIDVSGFGLRPGAQARVIACLNASGSAGCRDGVSQHAKDLGQPRTIN